MPTLAVPVAWANHPASGHGGTYKEKYGGDYARLVIDWLDWQLKGKTAPAETFLGGEAKGYQGWTIQAKHFVDFKNVKPLWIQNGDRQIYGELFTPSLTSLTSKKPIAIICNTEKGHGVDFMAGNVKWHGGGLGTEDYEHAIQYVESEWERRKASWR